MKKQLLSKNVLIWAGVGVLVIAAIYFFFTMSPSTSSSGLTVSSDSGATVGTQVLSLLNQIQSLRIDTTLFNDPAYLSLVDRTVAVPAVEVGRPDPFAPLPGVATPSMASTTAGKPASK
jgi:hypothetical protein